MQEAFAVPPHYQLEPELTAPLPRPVLDSIRRHPQRVARRQLSWRISVVFTVLCGLGLIFQNSPFMQAAGLYFTPFEYYWWVGWMCLAFSVWGLFHFWHPWKADPFLYLRQGITLPVRVVDIRREVARRVNGADTAFAYDVYVDFPDPQTQEMVGARLRSAEFGASSALMRCRVGDYLTAIYLPGDVYGTLNLYGLTKTNPDHDLLLPSQSLVSKRAVLLGLLGVFALCWGIFCYPLKSGSAQPVLMALAVSATIGAGLGFRHYRRSLLKSQADFQAAVNEGTAVSGETVRGPSSWGGVFLGMFCGGFVGMGALMFLNGALDFHASTAVPIQVSEVYCTTYQALVKTYEVEYRDPESGKTEKIGVNPLSLQNASRCELVTHPGALGLPWQEVRLIP